MTTVKKNQSISIAILAILTAAALFFAAWVSAVGVPSAGAVSKGTTACFNTAKGSVFLRTVCKPGERKVVLGLPGATGATGSVGPSAFDLAQVGGFSGTVADWLGSLVGLAGVVGIAGVAGTNGFDGTMGAAGPIGLTGASGADGVDGLSLPGEKGETGLRGAAGPAGTQGVAGQPGFIPSVGSFFDTTTQPNSSINEVNAFIFNNDPIANSGVVLKEKSKVFFEKAGVYNLQFSAQLFTSTKASVEQIDIWLATNGNDEANSNTQVQVRSLGDKTGKAVAAWNFLVTVQEGDYCELRWISDEPTMSIAAVAADLTPAKVAIPSVILSVVQVG